MAVAAESIETRSRLSILTGKGGLYTGKIPSLNRFLSSEKKSDAYICPHNLKGIESNRSYMSYIQDLSEIKPVVLFNMGDFPRKQIPGNFIFIQTTHEVGRSIDNSRTIIVPLNVRAISTKNRIHRNGNPVVSFVGQIPELSIGRWLRSILPIPPMPLELNIPAPIRRNSALIRKFGAKKLMENEGGITINRKFHGGSTHHVLDTDWNRALYENVMQNSDFIFSPRGDANNSFRLYEAISAGRIPVVPATSIYLPSLKDIDLADLILVTNCLSGNLWSRVEEYWNQLDVNTFEDIQNYLRHIFKFHLSYQRYLPKLFDMSVDEIRSLKPVELKPSH